MRALRTILALSAALALGCAAAVGAAVLAPLLAFVVVAGVAFVAFLEEPITPSRPRPQPRKRPEGGAAPVKPSPKGPPLQPVLVSSMKADA